MKNLSILLAWPFLILAFGLAIIAIDDIFPRSGGVVLAFALVVMVLIWLASPKRTAMGGDRERLDDLRSLVVRVTLGALTPIFVRYMLDAFDHALPMVIFGLVIGFGMIIWAMFIKGNKAVMHASVIGGALTVVYIYFQLWDLGEMARVIAAAFGLLVAVVISTIKLKDKLA